MTTKYTPRPRSIDEVREETREWLNYVCEEYFEGNVRRMAHQVGYEGAGRSKLDRVLKGKTTKIDDDLIEDVETFLEERYGRTAVYGPPAEPLSVKQMSFSIAEEEGGYVAHREVEGDYILDPVEVEGEIEDDRPNFMIEMMGDSMEPEFRSGERLLITTRVSEYSVTVDGVYLFRLEDTVQVKRLQRLPQHRIRVLSANDSYPPFEIDLKEEPDIEIIGKVWGRFERY